MAIAPTIYPSQLSGLSVATLTGETVGTLVPLTAIRQLDLTLATESVELRGDGSVVSTADQGVTGEFQMEAGGITLAAWAVITGKAFADTGTTPNVVRTMTLKSTDARPYFVIVGRALHDDTLQDLQVQIYRAKATGNIELSFQDGEYVTPTFNGTFIGRASDQTLMKIIHRETAGAIQAPA